jgi:ABC-type amino acid transport substrate-binding protein
MQRFRPAFAGLFACLSLMTAHAAQAASVNFAALIREPRMLDYPKPWPLQHLVTPGELTVGITAKDPPASFTNEDGQFDGARIKLFDRLAQDLDLKIHYVRLDWPGILPGLAADKFDLACEGASVTTTRLGSPDFFLSRPILANAAVAVALSSSPINNWKDVGDHRLGGVAGEAEFESVKAETPSASLVPLPGHQEGVLALRNGQIDLFAMDLLSAVALLNDPDQGSGLKLVGPAVDVGVQSLCVNKNEGDLLEAVNLLLTNYRVDGTLSLFEKEYYKTDADIQLLTGFGY